MSPRRFWAAFVLPFAAIFAVVDVAAARGPADGDTFSEVLASLLDSPAKRRRALFSWAVFAAWFPRHILKERH